MEDEFARKVAVVTGGASGIGRATALAFAKAGAMIVVADTTVTEGEELAHLIESSGGSAIFIRTDVTCDEQVEAMVAAAVNRFGRLDCAFNNAGIASGGTAVAQTSEEDWNRTIAVNLTGVFLCLKHECREMLRQKSGAIVNTSSMMGLVSAPGISAYSASKSGVLGLTKSVALDYAQHGIRVNAVCPGSIWTPMTEHAEARAAMEQISQSTPMQRLGVPREIADAVVWLCSDKASFMTGQSIAIDGGFTVW